MITVAQTTQMSGSKTQPFRTTIKQPTAFRYKPNKILVRSVVMCDIVIFTTRLVQMMTIEIGSSTVVS